MSVCYGSADLYVARGKKRCRIVVAQDRRAGWKWSAIREDASALTATNRLLITGAEKTWGAAYRASMRATDRLFRRKL